MPDKRTTIIEEPPVSADDVPGVVAYRVGQLEIAQKAGFKDVNDKLDTMISNFTPLARTVESEQRLVKLEATVSTLSDTNNRQQGAIDANRRNFGVALAILTIVVTGISIYFGVHK